MEKPWTGFCTIVAMDASSTCYNVCSICEKPVPETKSNAAPQCRFCNYNAFNPGSTGCKRLYKIFLSVATDSEVKIVLCFDRAARAIFGCSADEFFNFCKVNRSAAEAAGEILEGEMFEMTLSCPKNGNAEHLRVTYVVPARSDFCPVIKTLKEIYVRSNTPSSACGPLLALPLPAQRSRLSCSSSGMIPSPDNC